MKHFSPYFIIISILLFFFSCEKDNTQTTNSHPLRLTETLPGGCNIGNNDDLKILTIENDTMAFTLEQDTLDVYIGLNYSCCTPFTTETILSNDSVFIAINDVCGQTEDPCYCDCICYYTWDFLFTELEERKYYFRVTFSNPQREHPIVFKEATIEITQTSQSVSSIQN